MANAGVASGLLCAVVLGGSCATRDEAPSPVYRARDLTEANVRAILSESPGDYLVAVQEVVDDTACYGPADGSSCPLEVRVVEYLGGEPGRSAHRRLGWSYPTLEMRMEEAWPNRRIGRRRLVVATPVRTRPGWYGNRLFLVDPRPEDVERLRAILATIGTPGAAPDPDPRSGA